MGSMINICRVGKCIFGCYHFVPQPNLRLENPNDCQTSALLCLAVAMWYDGIAAARKQKRGVIMETMKINEQIIFLRKQKGMTQEEVACALGVTNQAVSKWESAQCCPDIQLLPAIAELFEVTIDELMGHKPAGGLGDICLKIRNYFTKLPEKESFEKAYRIAALLHEIALTDGYKKFLPWKKDKNYSIDEVGQWGLSLSVEDEGCTGRKNNCITFSLGKEKAVPMISDLRGLSLNLEKLSRIHVLKVMYALYSLTLGDSDLYVSCDEIGKETQLPISQVEEALKQLPLSLKEESESCFYRLEESFSYIPPLLPMLCPVPPVG